MFALSVRFLDGSCRDMKLGPETIAEVRSQLELDLPAFHAAQLFQGTEELQDGGAVKVEVQAVVTPSPLKALAELERLAPMIKERMKQEKMHVQDRRIAGCSFDLLQQMVTAAKALGEMQEFTPAVCEKLLHFLNSNLWTILEEMPGMLRKGRFGYGSTDEYYMMIGWRLIDHVARPLAAAFGRMCGESSLYLARLLEMAMRSQTHRCLATAAGIEIVLRCGVAALSSELYNELNLWAREKMREQRNYGELGQNAGGALVESFASTSCQWLGTVGDSDDTDMLQIVAALQWWKDTDVAAAAEAALHQIQNRSMKESPSNYESSMQEDTTTSVNSDAGVDAESGADADTDLQLEDALSKSEQEALLLEQGHLHEGILRSLVDCPSSTKYGSLDYDGSAVSGDRVVLLCFNRRPKELYDVLRASPLAARFEAAGGVLQPKWAAGRLIFAESVTQATINEGHGDWHVAVRAGDEAEIHEALRSTLGRERPRLKASDGRFLLPQGTSLFQLSDGSAAGDAHSFDESPLSYDWADLVVQRSFLHIPIKEVASPRTSASAPAAL